MGSTNFLQWDINKSNMISDDTYLHSDYRINGCRTGMAPSNQHNKLFYQMSTMVSALAQSLANKGYIVNDDDFNTLVSILSNLGSAGSRMQIFLASGTFTAPSQTVQVSQAGGGGGGTAFWGLGGGGGSSVYRQTITNLNVGQQIPVTVGAGGIAGWGPITTTATNGGNWDAIFSSHTINGGNGGTTSFGNYIVSLGGNGGQSTTTTANSGTSGGVGGNRGDLPSVAGITSVSSSTVDVLRNGGCGGSTLFGVGGNGGQYALANIGTSVNGGNGIGYGSGGGGGSDYQSPSTNVYKTTGAGNGAPGIVIVEW